MKRAIALLITVLAVPAFGFRTSLSQGDRVGVLRPDDGVARIVAAYLTNALKGRGLDAFDVRMKLTDLRTDERVDADYYVEIVDGDGDAGSYGGIGVGNRTIEVDVAVVVSRVAAKMRLYDGRTLELVDEYDLQRSNTTLLPTAVGIGGRHVAAWIALPFVQYARYRSAARAVAGEAAQMIAVEASKQQASRE